MINLIYLDVLCYSIKDDRPSQTANLSAVPFFI